MAQTVIAVGDGTGTNLLSSNAKLSYDLSDNNANLAADASTIGSGANNSVNLGGTTNEIAASCDNSANIASAGSEINASNCLILGGLGHVINSGATGCVIIGGQTTTIATNATANIAIGASHNITGIGNISMGSGTTMSGTGSFCWQDGVITDDYATNYGFGIFGGSGALITDITGAENAASAVLTLNSTTKGLRLPVLTTTQMNAISSPAAGLVIYNSTDGELYRYNGSAWTALNAQFTTSINSTISGIWSAPQNITYTLFRTGTLVNLCWTTRRATANTAAVISSVAGVIPSAYRPGADYVIPYRCINNTVNQVGGVSISTAGTITWQAGNFGSFTGSGDSGVFACGVSYTTAA